jgi:hypothetical protein
MSFTIWLRGARALVQFTAALLVSLWAASASAGNFIGLAQPGTPGTFGVLMFPTFSHTSPNTNTGKTFTELAYYTKTGFTGTARDQFEVWTGFYGGYQTPARGSQDSGWGAALPELGLEYYYQIVQPDGKFCTPEYRTWWISPYITMNAPNGSSKNSGFGAGSNQYSASATVNNYVAYGLWHATIAPVTALYLFRNRNETSMSETENARLRGGLTLVLMDMAAGYQVRDNMIVGVHHAFNIYGVKDSDFPRATEGMVGPTFTYLGFAKDNLYLAGTLDVDYHHHNTPRNVALNFMLVKSF